MPGNVIGGGALLLPKISRRNGELSPRPLQPGMPVRYDYEYRWMGTCNLFMFFQPRAG